MKNLLFLLKAVKTGTLKAQVGAGAGARAGVETFWKSEPEREPERKKIVSAPQPWMDPNRFASDLNIFPSCTAIFGFGFGL